MKLQDQVCTKGQAVTLKSLGIAQTVPFSWLEKYDFPVINGRYSPDNPVSAYTTAELGEMLSGHNEISMTSWRNNAFLVWQCEVDRPDPDDPLEFIIIASTEAPTEAQARAAALIYLLEMGTITTDQVNDRLKALGEETEG